MKVLVTGASGFVGMHLCERLLDEGHTVYALVRTPKKMSSLNHPHLHLIKGDLLDSPLLFPDLLPSDLDACIHTAGIVHSFVHDEFYQCNAEATKDLVIALINKYSHSFKFLLISSLAAGGPSEKNIPKTELEIDLPVSVYGRSKKLAEQYLHQHAPAHWDVQIIRPPMVIGPRDTAVLDVFKMVKDGFILLPGLNAKEKLYSFICVFDLVESIYKTLLLNQSAFFYVTHPEQTTYFNLIETIQNKMQKKKVTYIPVPFFIITLLANILNFIYHYIFKHNIRLTTDKICELKPNAWVCSNVKSVEEIHQIYIYDLDKCIEVTLNDYQKQGWI